MNATGYRTALLGVIVATASYAAVKPSVVAPGATLQKLCDGFSFTEGPAADAEGNVFFTDQPNDRILKWSADGKLSVFLSPCGRSNGLYFDRQGNLWACADLKNELWRIDPQSNVTVIVTNYKGKKLNGPNDAWIAPDGGIYITDPYYKRNYWTRGPMEQDGEHVYYLTPDRTDLIRAISDLTKPNGIIGTPGGDYLYVADIGANKTYRYKINQNGSLSEKRLFCGMGSDGMAIDAEGNLYLTGSSGVTVFNPHGKQIERMVVPGSWTGNVTFGGEDRRTLFITAGVALYGLRMRVEGASMTPDFNHDSKVDIEDLLLLIQSWGQNDLRVDIAPPLYGDGVVDRKDLERVMNCWNQELLDPTLLAHWNLDEAEGTVANDADGDYNGTLHGEPVWQPEAGMIGGALLLDGSGDYISTESVLDPAAGPFSLFAWVKGDTPSQIIVSQKDGRNWLAVAQDGTLTTQLSGSSRVAPVLTTATPITDGQWHRVGLVWDGSKRILYVDNAEAARDDSVQAALTRSTKGLYIGAGSTLATETFWSGLIDDVRIYDRAVTP